MPHTQNPHDPQRRLSPHFTLAELTVSNSGARAGLRNVPVGTALDNLTRLAQLLEGVRTVLHGAPILVSSGYRSPAINNLVGGSLGSAHMRGLAADFIAPRFGPPRAVCEAIRASSVQFDQLIFEGTWVHIAAPAAGAIPRREVLTAVFRGGMPVQYLKGLA